MPPHSHFLIIELMMILYPLKSHAVLLFFKTYFASTIFCFVFNHQLTTHNVCIFHVVERDMKKKQQHTQLISVFIILKKQLKLNIRRLPRVIILVYVIKINDSHRIAYIYRSHRQDTPEYISMNRTTTKI